MGVKLLKKNVITILAELLVKKEGTMGYWVYIFKNLETEDMYKKYIMCTRFPNWEHSFIKEGSIGYLTYEEHYAGISQWYDGTQLQYYKYTGVQFISFIDKPKENKTNKQLIL